MCFGNVVAEKDGAVAAAMAVGRILAGEEGPSVYETDRPEGFLFV